MSDPYSAPPPPPPAAPTASASASNRAITALVLGILSVICCSILGPVAWYLGVDEGRAIREGRSSVAGEGMALAAKILGIIGTVFLIFGILWVFFLGGMAVLQGIAAHH